MDISKFLQLRNENVISKWNDSLTMRYYFTHNIGEHYEYWTCAMLCKHVKKWGLSCVSGGVD